VLAVGSGSGDENARLTPTNSGLSGLGARVVDTKVGTQVILDSLSVETGADSDTVRGGEGVDDAHADTVTA
jgi:hypothetical protein